MDSQLWQIQQRTSSSDFREYKFVATASERGDTFTLDCSWEQCLYCLTIYKNGIGEENIVFARAIFADANPDKYVDQIMRIARRDIARKLARLDQLHTDGMIGIGGLASPGED